jgi:hypothetical protein
MKATSLTFTKLPNGNPPFPAAKPSPSYSTSFAFHSGSELDHGFSEWIRFYNEERGYSFIEDRTPYKVYYGHPYPFAETV